MNRTQLMDLDDRTEDVRLPITPCTDAAKPLILAAMAEAGLA